MASSGVQSDPAINLDFVNIPTAATPPAATPAVAQYSAAVQAGSGIDTNFGIFSLLSPSFWLAAFNVDTAEVVLRLRSALWPFRRSESFLTVLGGKPDLWVPIWVPATLVAVLMFGSNLSSYLHFTESPTVPIYRADFSKLVEAAFVVYCFSVGAPALSWLALLYSGIGAVGVVSLTCLYGYSLAVYIPAALLCVFPSALLQWASVLAATAVSTFLVLSNVARVIVETGYPMTSAAKTILMLQVVAHVSFGVCLKLFFFTFSPAK